LVSVSPTQLVVTLPAELATTAPMVEPVVIQTLGSPNSGALTKASPSNAGDVGYEPTPTLTALHVLTARGSDASYAAGPTTGGTEIELIGKGFGPQAATQAADGLAGVAFTDVGAAGQKYGLSDATVTQVTSGSESEAAFDTLGDDPGIDQVSWCNLSGCTAPLAEGDTFTYYPTGDPRLPPSNRPQERRVQRSRSPVPTWDS
jgi:hypothetical protein